MGVFFFFFWNIHKRAVGLTVFLAFEMNFVNNLAEADYKLIFLNSNIYA